MDKKITKKYLNLHANAPTKVTVVENDKTRVYELMENEKINNIVVNRELTNFEEYNAEVIYDEDIVKVSQSDEREYADEQVEFNNSTRQVGNINFTIRGNAKNPKRIIVTFPKVMYGKLPIKYNMDLFEKLDERFLNENLILALQDNYAEFGTYLLLDDNGNMLKEKVIVFLKKIIEKYNLTDNEVIFYGVNAGATMALYYGSAFENAEIFAITPQIDVKSKENFFRNAYNVYLDVFKRIEFNIIDELLIAINNNQKINLVENFDDIFGNKLYFSNGFYSNKNFNLILSTNDKRSNTSVVTEELVTLKILENSTNNEFEELQIAPEYEMESLDIRDFSFTLSLEDKAKVGDDIYLKLSPQTSITLNYEVLEDGKVKYFVDESKFILGPYIKSYNVNDYPNLTVVFTNLEKNIYFNDVVNPVVYANKEFGMDVTDNIIKFSPKYFESRKRYIACIMETVCEEEELNEIIKNNVSLKVIQASTGKSINIPLTHKEDSNMFHTEQFVDLGFDLTQDDILFISETNDTKEVYGQTLSYEELSKFSVFN